MVFGWEDIFREAYVASNRGSVSSKFNRWDGHILFALVTLCLIRKALDNKSSSHCLAGVMNKRRMGPPYLNPPPEKHIVVSNAWGLPQPEQRGPLDFMRLGGWLRVMLRPQTEDDSILAEVVYHKRTEEAVIVQLSDKANLAPILGAHHWSSFWLRPPRPPSDVSYIFEYNWRNNGDPSNRDWEFTIPDARVPPRDFPIRDPYPAAVWSERPKNVYFRSLTIALPPPPPAPTATPAPQPRVERPALLEERSASSTSTEPKFQVDKRDSYEQEDAAELLLRAPDPTVAVKTRIEGSRPIKAEPNESFRIKQEPRNSRSRDHAKAEEGQPDYMAVRPADRSAPAPSAAIADAFQQLQANGLIANGAPRAQEPRPAVDDAPHTLPQKDPRRLAPRAGATTHPSAVTVKPEPLEPTSISSVQGHGSPLPRQMTASTESVGGRLKRLPERPMQESEGSGQSAVAKRIKMEPRD